MLRITNTTRPDGVTLVVEGRLAGPWVEELARCWWAARATHDGAAISVELCGVTFVDRAANALLRAMHADGAVLAASGCMTQELVEEIKRSVARHRGD